MSKDWLGDAISSAPNPAAKSARRHVYQSINLHQTRPSSANMRDYGQKRTAL